MVAPALVPTTRCILAENSESSVCVSIGELGLSGEPIESVGAYSGEVDARQYLVGDGVVIKAHRFLLP